MNTVLKDEPDDAKQYLTFRLGGEEYAVGILTVQEIRGWAPVTAIPHSPREMLGVINLRGVVVPIVDLRLKFALERADYNEFTVVIILNVGARVAGIVVDGVSDVITLTADQIRAAPALGRDADTDHIVGFGTLEERMRIILDVERLLANLGDTCNSNGVLK
ncbi:MAG TPA: chemotaxis protein CheW [Steroidobacteraceae bacterium]|nr:chemotaxis protein CheW [Steroidobacteraceae bacterium]